MTSPLSAVVTFVITTAEDEADVIGVLGTITRCGGYPLDHFFHTKEQLLGVEVKVFKLFAFIKRLKEFKTFRRVDHKRYLEIMNKEEQ